MRGAKKPIRTDTKKSESPPKPAVKKTAKKERNPADKPAENVFRLNARTDILPMLFPVKAATRSQLPENRAVKFAESVIASLHRENVPQLMKQHYHVKKTA